MKATEPHTRTRAVDEAARLGLVHQHAVVERHGRRPDAAPDQADQQAARGRCARAGRRPSSRWRRRASASSMPREPADAMGEQADAEHRDHADELAAHEQRADLGVGDAAVAQPHRPVAHEGAGREEVGRAVAGQPPALDDADSSGRELAAHLVRVLAERRARRPAAPVRRRRRRRGPGSRPRPWARRRCVRRSCGCLERSPTVAHPRPGDLRGVELGGQRRRSSARRSSSPRSRWSRRAGNCAPCWWRSRDPSPARAGRARRGRGARTRGRSGSRSAPAPCRRWDRRRRAR